MKKIKILSIIVIIMLIAIMIISSIYTKVSYKNINNPIMASKYIKGAMNIADSNTMDSYIGELLSDEYGSRYAGRVWSDKSVSTNNITLDTDTDGYSGTIVNSSDFLHSFSVLGSSQEYSGQLPTNMVIVIDNSGSMYGNAKEWEKTRVAMTVKAVNNTIDKLMRENSENEVAVVLFGDGSESEGGGTETAQTIIPMEHYDYGSNNNVLEYLSAGWSKGTPENPDHISSSSGGYVYVNKKLINEGDGYKKYKNGTTNIQAGIYQGMKELIDAKNKIAEIDGITVTKKPFLVLLTDGAATNCLDGVWSNPTENGKMKEKVFTNDRGDKWSSFIKEYSTNNGSSYTYFWNMLTEIKEEGGVQKLKQVGYGDGSTKSGVILNNANPGEQGVEELKKLAKKISSTQGHMVLSTLMTAGYMKAVVEKEYNEKCDVSTISVDMPNPENIVLTEKSGNSLSYDISTGQVLMDPKNFTKEYLKDKGYLKTDDLNNLGEEDTAYESYTIGSETILGICDAIDAWNEWKNNKNTEECRNKLNTYVAWDEKKGLYDEMEKGEKMTIDIPHTSDKKEVLPIKPIGPDHGNAFIISKVYENIEYPNLTKGDTETNPYNLSDEDIDINYANTAYYPSSTDETNSITSIFEEIMNSITNRPFTPINGKNDANVSDSLTYTDPIGDYMEIKNNAITVGNSNYDMALLLFGEMHGLVRTAVYDYSFNSTHKGESHNSTEGNFVSGWYNSQGTWLGSESSNGSFANGDIYYVDAKTARQFVPTLPDNNLTSQQEHTVYTFYRIAEDSDERNKYRWNSCYGEAPSENQDMLESLYASDSPGVYKLSDIRVWVEDTGDFQDTTGTDLIVDAGYDEAIYINIPTDTIPLQIADISISENKIKEYKTNLSDKKQSTPMRVFYSVGMSENIIENGNINLSLISEEYINKNKDENNTIYFYSNYYSEEDYNGDGIENTTFGNAATTFTPAGNNRFYFFQKNLVIYENSINGDKNGEGELAETGGNVILSNPVTDLNSIDKNKTYYFAIDYYNKEKQEYGDLNKLIKYVVAHKGSEFYGKDGECYLTYYNEETEQETPQGGENIVVATKIGGKRVGNLNKVATEKTENITNTADYSYVPTYGEKGFVNHMGNNGRMAIDDNLLRITKTVYDESEETEEQFNFTVSIPGMQGKYGAIECKWNGEEWVPETEEMPEGQEKTKTTFKNIEVNFDENGQAQITLKNKTGLIFRGLKAGTTYTVTENMTNEQQEKGYLVTINGRKQDKDIQVNNNIISGAIESGVLEEVNYINAIPEISNEITKTGTNKIASKDDLVSYTVQYTTQIDKYIGDAVITIVDTLPYKIDQEKTDIENDLDGGVYDEENQTITWTIEVKDIDTISAGNPKTITIQKNIMVIFSNIEVGQSKFTNTVKGKTELKQSEKQKETEPATHDTTTEFIKDITVIKQWDYKENIYERPTKVKLKVKKGEEVVQEYEVGEEDNWTHTFTGLQRYDENGEEIEYTIDEEAIEGESIQYYKREAE